VNKSYISFTDHLGNSRQQPNLLIALYISHLEQPRYLFQMKTILLSVLLPALASAATTNGKFTALSFNVAGLPSILQSNDVNGTKSENAKLLGTYFSEYGYDIINMQEVPLHPVFLVYQSI
jgi:hypothetical protein